MYKSLSREIMTVTPTNAVEYLKLNTLNAQRNLVPAHIKRLEGKIKDGRFRIGSLGVAIISNGNKEKRFLVNGQHQLSAVINSGMSIEVTLEKYICDDDSEVSSLYRQFDTHYSRSISHMVKVEGDALSLEVPLSILGLVVNAIGKIEKITDKEKKVEALNRYQREAYFVSDVLRTAYRKKASHMGKIPVVIVMIRSFRKDESDAYSFWSGVRDGEALMSNMPEFVLREFLLRVALRATKKRERTGYIVSSREIEAKCVLAWNKFRERETLKMLRYFNKSKMPRVI